jgi:hypothetical protein
MCHERVDTDNGKYFVSWSYWYAPGQQMWRKLEPRMERSELVPLWKPPKPRHNPNIMIHEGAKAARFCDNLVNNESATWFERQRAHPWLKYLSRFEHWGFITGAMNPHRSEWGEVRDAVDRHLGKVVCVCDNDEDGILTAGPIAREFKGFDFSIIRFNKLFPVRFDCADPVPQQIDGRYPDINDFIRSAIWATEEIETEIGADDKPKRGRPAYRLRQQFARQWRYAVKPGVFVSRNKRRDTFSLEEFNSYIRPFSDIEDTARLVKQRFEMQADGLAYKPGKNVFELNEDQQRLINTWMPGPVETAGQSARKLREAVNSWRDDPAQEAGSSNKELNNGG